MTQAQHDEAALISAYEIIRGQAPWKHPRHNIAHQPLLPLATLAPWLTDADFLGIYERIRNHTLVDLYRCYELWSLAYQTATVEGDIVEVGVWRGGSGALLAHAVRNMPGKRVYLADTFSGVVKAGVRDSTYRGGEHADTSKERVAGLLQQLELSAVELLPGVFPEQTQHLVRGSIALLHCDVDVYSSARDVAEWAIPRLTRGAVMVFDDYGFHGCEGVTEYCNELRQHPDFRFVYNLNGHALFFKIR